MILPQQPRNTKYHFGITFLLKSKRIRIIKKLRQFLLLMPMLEVMGSGGADWAGSSIYFRYLK